ncbi:hypothetical protein C6361_34645 [Plantactinospora sp. BC1]|nr:hypothetical protein C6361_34645 [Plantactinospora sp. BC1]
MSLLTARGLVVAPTHPREYRSRTGMLGVSVIVMFGAAGFGWPAGFVLLGPAAVCVTSAQSHQPGRLDSGARG